MTAPSASPDPALATPTTPAGGRRPIEPEDLLAIKTISDVQLSPDGPADRLRGE